MIRPRNFVDRRHSRALNVVHVVPLLFSKERGIVGGAERYVMELARHMAEETPTSLIAFGDEERDETIGKLRLRVIGRPWYVRGQRSNPFSTRLLGELRGRDVIHCHQQHVLASSAAAAWAWLTGRRVFVSDLGGGGWDISAYFSTDRWYHGHLHISDYSRRIYGHQRLAHAHVVYGGVDSRQFSPGADAAKRDRVVFVGRLLPHKGINYLIEAMPADIELEVVGQGYDNEYLQYLKSLSAGKRVLFRHDCDDAGLVEIYRRAMCVVLPSVYKSVYGAETKVPELLGQTLLEGMACGSPAICTNVASMPEVVTDGLTGFVVAPNDPEALRKKILWLRANPQQAVEMGRAARQRALDHFSWQQVVRKCLEIYQGSARDN